MWAASIKSDPYYIFRLEKYMNKLHIYRSLGASTLMLLLLIILCPSLVYGDSAESYYDYAGLFLCEPTFTMKGDIGDLDHPPDGTYRAYVDLTGYFGDPAEYAPGSSFSWTVTGNGTDLTTEFGSMSGSITIEPISGENTIAMTLDIFNQEWFNTASVTSNAKISSGYLHVAAPSETISVTEADDHGGIDDPVFVVGATSKEDNFTLSGKISFTGDSLYFHWFYGPEGTEGIADIQFGFATPHDGTPPPGPNDPPVYCKIACNSCGTLKCGGDNVSTNPIQYSTGEIIMGTADMSDPAGKWLSARRSYDNLSADYDGPNGWNWFVDRIPHVLRAISGDDNHLLVEATPGNSIAFDLTEGGYIPRFPIRGLVQTLSHDSTSHTYTYTEAGDDGTSTWIFHDVDQTTYPKGILASYTDSSGITTAVTSYTYGNVGEIERSCTIGGITTIYSLIYDYFSSGEHQHKIQSATLRHTTDGTTWTTDRKVLYDYYTSTDATPASGLPQGSLNDLKLVTVEDPSGAMIDATYYRYYAPVLVTSLTNSSGTATAAVASPHGLSVGNSVTIAGASQLAYNGTFLVTAVPDTTHFSYTVTGSPATDTSTSITAMTLTTGFPHGLKYVVNAASYARLLTNVGDPAMSSISDGTLAGYADNYFEYDADRRVTKEVAQGAGCSCSGGNGQGTFTYTRSTNSNTSYTDAVNNWNYKIVEQMSNMGTVQYTNTIYSNYRHQTMLKVYNDGDGSGTPPKWCWYHHFDSDGRIDWEAMPSAVNGIDESKLNPIDATTDGDYGHLNSSTGLINVHNYGTSTTATASTAGDVLGYIKSEQVKQGYSGTAITTEAFAYWKQIADVSTTGDGLVPSPIRWRATHATMP